MSRPGQPKRLLDPPQRPGEWALSILADHLGDPIRAADLAEDFAALTLSRFQGDWVMGANDVEDAITEAEILRARWRIALMRG